MLCGRVKAPKGRGGFDIFASIILAFDYEVDHIFWISKLTLREAE